MKLVTSLQMQEIDRQAIDGLGIPSLELMENAGRGIARHISELLEGEVKGKRIAIFSGKGNNGGDGFVVARYLNEWGASAEVYLLAAPDDYQGDALVNYQKIVDLKLPVSQIKSVEDSPDLSSADLVVDAIFGTGFRDVARGLISTVIESINSAEVPVLAVDTPSGLNSDTGEVEGPCIRADYTSTLALPKTGQFFYPGRSYCGSIRVIDIGIPGEEFREVKGLNLATPSLVAEKVPTRDPTYHKGDCGKLFILAGSVGMTGAAALAAQAAVRAGAGLVYLGVPRSLNDILEVKLTEALTKPLPELRKQRALPVRALGPIIENIREVDACCLGPGVGRHFETIELFRRLVGRIEKPIVLDADGLYPFNGKPELLKTATVEMVLTPHAGELARLTGSSLPEKQLERIEPLRAYTAEIGKVVLLKGAPTLICSPEGEIYVCPTGNAGMASGGCGDVLTGTIGSLLASGMSALDSAVCGAFLHGFAGDLAAADIGLYGLIASDVNAYLPEAFRLVVEEKAGTFSSLSS
ncbi:MAG: NAD(P)H-hydrate dehydratase [candidate division Zixibacteria bacterium]|nr:NAD(P)H-hydrate dehydratase [candidate division Zixibacteria bacterium]